MAISGGSGVGAAGVVGAAVPAGSDTDDSDSSSSSSTIGSLKQESSAGVTATSSSSSDTELARDPVITFEGKILRHARSNIDSLLHTEGLRAVSLIKSGGATKEEILSQENKARLFNDFVGSVMTSYSSHRSELGDEVLGNSQRMDKVTTELSQGLFSIFERGFSRLSGTIDMYSRLSSSVPPQLQSLDHALRGLFAKK
ncbi:hypothetical protein [Candidatus Ichthyocystis hellenicum]|uniref:hypothetical protein n=1 Tax=Candidatus Ichthyocystis hellenicum TaxID=1561003 RepID=UPI000B839190|nr:hypothetical protein [Candidatus Ichthyocystis hellenicum]